MSDDLKLDDVNKVHEQAKKLTQKTHDYTIGGKSDEVAFIASNAANPAIQAKIDAEKKRKSDDLLLLKRIELAQKELSEIREQISEKLDDLADSLDLSKRIREAMESGNMAQLTLLLQEAHRDTEGKTPDELMEMARDELGVQQTKQETLIEEIKILAEQYRNRANQLGKDSPELEAEELQKLVELREQAQAIPGLNFEEVFGECFEADRDNKFYETALTSVDREQATRNFSDESVITDPFNQAAGHANPFAPSSDQTLTAGVKETPANPFDVVAEPPPNPFG